MFLFYFIMYFIFTGLLNFGKFDSFCYGLIELPIYVVMGGIGGLLGALFNQINFYITVFRARYATVHYYWYFRLPFTHNLRRNRHPQLARG